MKIFILRHGQTTGDVEDRYGGDYDDDLTEKGVEQAKEAANNLRHKCIEIIFHSPKRRAVHTAKIIEQKLKVPLKEVPDFRERNNYGIVTGMTKKEAKKLHPKEVEKLETIWMHHGVTGSEAYEQFKERVLKALNKATNGPHFCIAIVAHGGPIGCICRELLGKEYKKIDDCAILEMNKSDDGYELTNTIGIEFK